jgi:hypothetical protein
LRSRCSPTVSPRTSPAIADTKPSWSFPGSARFSRRSSLSRLGISLVSAPRRSLCSWAGLTPRHYESDTKARNGRITKQGSRLPAVGRDRGHPAGPGRIPHAPPDGGHHRPPPQRRPQHSQGRPGPQAARPHLLWATRRRSPLPEQEGRRVNKPRKRPTRDRYYSPRPPRRGSAAD